MALFGSLSLNQVMHVSLFEASVSQALFREAHGIYEVAHAKLLEACSKQRARVADTLLCKLILLQPNPESPALQP